MFYFYELIEFHKYLEVTLIILLDVCIENSGHYIHNLEKFFFFFCILDLVTNFRLYLYFRLKLNCMVLLLFKNSYSVLIISSFQNFNF